MDPRVVVKAILAPIYFRLLLSGGSSISASSSVFLISRLQPREWPRRTELRWATVPVLAHDRVDVICSPKSTPT